MSRYKAFQCTQVLPPIGLLWSPNCDLTLMPDVRMTIGRKLFRPDFAVGVRASDHRVHRRSGLPGHLQQVRRDAGQDQGHQGSILKATIGNYKLCQPY